MAWIRIEVGASRRKRGRRLRVRGTRVLIGRDPDCTVRVKDDQVSRKHAILVLSGQGWLVQDLGSVNGTLLNGRHVATAELRARDVVRLGEAGPKVHVLEFDPPAPETRREPVPPGAGSDGDDDLEATRYVRVDPESPSPAPAAPVDLGRGVRVLGTRELAAPWLLVLGMLAGVVTGLEAWPAAFPYRAAAAPAVWAAHLVGLASPELLHSRAAWLVVIALGAYAGAWGFGFQRVRRRWPLLVALALLHAAAYFALPKLGGAA